MQYTSLIQKYPIISDQIDAPALGVVLRELETCLIQGVSGDIAEFGCYIGTSSLFIRRLLGALDTDGTRAFHVYDSFAGLPAKGLQDQSGTGLDFTSGALSVSKKQLQAMFHKAHVAPPVIHKAWFEQLGDSDVPSSLAYAFLDGDFYSSIIDSLRLAWPRLMPGGAITIDDYNREALPGVTRAVTDFFQDKAITLHHEHNIAVIRAG
jgi:O-methyltransferase